MSVSIGFMPEKFDYGYAASNVVVTLQLLFKNGWVLRIS